MIFFMENHQHTTNSNRLDVFAIHGLDRMQNQNSTQDRLNAFP